MPMHKKHWIKCPECKASLERVAHVIVQHFRSVHKMTLSEAEAFRIASPQKKDIPYTDNLGMSRAKRGRTKQPACVCLESKPARIRLESIPSPIGAGICSHCNLPKEVFGANTNHGHLSLCNDCLRQARNQGKRKPRPEFETIQKAKDITDALAHRISGSYGTGKKR